ncbi:hypothetical protein ACHAXS_001256 [Conticribra weissflogii]
MLCSFTINASIFIYIDSQYYSQKQTMDNMAMHRLNQNNEKIGDEYNYLLGHSYTDFITPLNAFLYNSKAENLAEHGLHPRITHAVVNMPMLFGPLALIGFASVFQMLFRGSRSVSSAPGPSIFRNICLWVIESGLLILSYAPHQEPRFILPCLVPLVFLYGREAVGMERCVSTTNTASATTTTTKGVRSKNILVLILRVTWVVFNLLSYLFFGWLHQGGLITSLREMQSNISKSELEDAPRNSNYLSVVIYYHTYMPPTFLTREERQSSYSCGNCGCNVDGTCTDVLAWTNNGECSGGHSRSCGMLAILDLQGSNSTKLVSVLEKLLPCTRNTQNLADAGSSYDDMNMIYIVSPPVVVSSLKGFGRIGLDTYSFRKLHGYRGHVSTEDWPIFNGTIMSFVEDLELAVYRVSCWDDDSIFPSDYAS